MHDSPISPKLLVISTAIATFILALLFGRSFLDNHTKIVFCDVGQGDGTYMRIRNKFDVLIDAGPNDSILNCLGKYMPYYDRQIELAILTHPDFDHYYGFIPVLARYDVKAFFMPPLTKDAVTYHKLLVDLKEEATQIYFPKYPDKFSILRTDLTFYWPTADFLTHNITYPTPQTTNNFPGQSLGSASADTNDFSSIFVFEQDGFRTLFTGDTDIEILEKTLLTIPLSNDRKIAILKVPHHGSKYGLTQKLLQLADPTLSVISAGKKNRYGHPSKDVLSIYKSLNKNYVRTDEEGSIVIEVNSTESRGFLYR